MSRRRCIPAAELQAHARDRASTWRVWRTRGTGKNTETVVKLVDAASEKEAITKGGGARKVVSVRPVLPTSEWTALREEFGPPCFKGRRR